MNLHSSTIKKYYPALIGAALIAASLFQFSRPVFSAGTEAGQKIRNTATGTYEDNDGNDYTIDSNTVEVTVAKVAGITNIPTGFTDGTTSATNTSVLTGDTVSFEFTITNVGNDISNIYIPGTAANIATKGLDPATMVVQVSQPNPGNNPTFSPYTSLTSGIFPNVPINGQIIVKVTARVTATAAGAPIEVRLGDTGSNTDPNTPVADTQNQFDTGTAPDVAVADNEVRTLNVTGATPEFTLDAKQQKEASAVQQVSLGSNPLAMAKIEKTRGVVSDGPLPTLKDNVVPYSLKLEVQSNTPNAQFTPGKLKGRNFGTRVTGVTDTSDLILVSDAIPANTVLEGAPTASPTNWTLVYAVGAEPATVANKNLAADQLQWIANPPSGFDFKTVTRIGWVYDARATPAGNGPIDPGTTVTGFTFDVVTDGLNATTGGTVANLGQVFGGTVGGDNVFDESGDQDPSNFNGINLGPSETDAGSTGIADPDTHGVDTDNNNSATGSSGGEDNIIDIGAPGKVINGPDGQPTATGKIFNQGPDNNHDFQNKGISNFSTATCTSPTTPPLSASGNPQTGQGCKLDPNEVTFNNTLKNPGSSPISQVYLQPVPPAFGSLSGNNSHIPDDTKVTINLGTQQAIYVYTAANGFELQANSLTNPSKLIILTSLAGGASVDYTVKIDLPANTGLSTDLDHGFPVPIIAFADGGIGDAVTATNFNFTINQVYTDFIKVTKEVEVLKPDGTTRTDDPLPGDILVYRVKYRNISEPGLGNGFSLVLNGKDVMIDENGTQAKITGMAATGNNWGLDNNNDSDLDTINVQNTAKDSNSGSTITYYTGTSPATAGSTPATASQKYSVDTLTSAGTTDPGDTVTGYRSTIPTLAPSATDFIFEFQRKVDEYDGLAQEGLP